MIDQDQSDNVTSKYLHRLRADGAVQSGECGGAAERDQEVNGSDNALISFFLDPTLACTPFTAPDLSQAGTPEHLTGAR